MRRWRALRFRFRAFQPGGGTPHGFTRRGLVQSFPLRDSKGKSLDRVEGGADHPLKEFCAVAAK
ncbi:MAG: hypothetical protein AMXMBFR34_44720 [Myxococcaceae bacterium]